MRIQINRQHYSTLKDSTVSLYQGFLVSPCVGNRIFSPDYSVGGYSINSKKSAP